MEYVLFRKLCRAQEESSVYSCHFAKLSNVFQQHYTRGSVWWSKVLPCLSPLLKIFPSPGNNISEIAIHLLPAGIFDSIEEPEDRHKGWKSRYLICAQFRSNLCSYSGFACFLISHKQFLRKSVQHAIPEMVFQNPPPPLKLPCCYVTRSQRFYIQGKFGHEGMLISLFLLSSLHRFYTPIFL